MRVINLKVENFQRLVAVDITPTGDIVTLVGKNAQGKSSVLDGLWALLEGAAHLPTQPVHTGAERALLRVALGANGVVKYIATRTISNKAAGGYTTQVKVENADGAVFPSPQKLLDDLIGELSFDPLEFTRMSDKAQFGEMAKLVPGIDFEAVSNLNRGDYEKRTDVNRRAREARAAAGIIAIPAEIPEKRDDKALVEQLGGATAREAEISEHGRRKAALDQRLAGVGKEIDSLEAERKAMAERLAVMEKRAGQLKLEAAGLVDEVAAFPAAPERIDTQAVADQLRDAQAHNRNVEDILERVKKRDSMVRLAESLEREAGELTNSIDARTAAQAKAVSEAKMPVPGIGFGDGVVLLNGVPFSQASSAEKIQTSVAIAAAMNPKLRVIHIRDGSLLDSDTLAWLTKYAQENDLQVWLEKVADDAKVGFVIEDGHVKDATAAA
jgi:hypothetical protein